MRKINAIWSGCLALLLLNISHANEKNYPCSGVPGAYITNPDGSEGGFVASSATVDPTVHLEMNASVCERASVIEGAKVLDYAEVSGRAIVRGKVIIQDRAKVYGEAYVINLGGDHLVVRDEAKIYGHGFLQGSVNVANNSEVFSWGKVLDHAQVLGYSLVCGWSILKDFEVIHDDSSRCVQ
jgi:carbonic anhydrase/acetyltransferase-like protein (isoleucine patch superfamily)